MPTDTQGDLDVRPVDAVTAAVQLPDLADLVFADEGQHDPHGTGAAAGLAEPGIHDSDDSRVEAPAVDRERVVMGDDYDAPTVELYPPRERPELPLPPLRGRHRLTVERRADTDTYLVREHTYVPRQRVASWVLVALAAVLVTLMLVLSVWLAAGVPAEPMPMPTVEAPATATTPTPPGGAR